MSLGPINYGYAPFFFKKITVSAGTYNTTADVIVNLAGGVAGYSLSNETGSTTVEVSYDGNSAGDELNSAQATKFVQYDNRDVCKIWLRITSGASAVVVVRAWSPRS